MFTLIFYNYYTIKEKNLVLLHLLTDQDVKALQFIDKEIGQNKVVLADPLISFGVYPISKNHVVAIQGANIGLGDMALSGKFFNGNCVEKQKIMTDEKVDIVLSRISLSCPFLIEIYNQKDFVYKVVQ